MLTKMCKVLVPTATIITAVALVANVIAANWHYALVLGVLLVANVNSWIDLYNKV